MLEGIALLAECYRARSSATPNVFRGSSIALLFVDGDCKFVRYTTAQMIPIIKIQNQTIVFMADLLPSIGHIPLPYIMGYDTQPLITLKEKEDFLKEAAQEKYILFLEHDYNYECCTVMETPKGVRIEKYGKLKDFLI